MSFGAWSSEDMVHLEKQLTPDLSASWDSLCPPGRKTAANVAEQIALLPFSNTAGIETAAHTITEKGGGIHRELPDGVEVMRELAMTENPELRLVAKTVQAAGGGNAREMLRGGPGELPKDAEQAAGLLAMERIAENAAKVKAMHKERILKCMEAMVSVMREVIKAKKSAIDEARVERTDGPIASESDISSDEKGWQSSTEDGP
jgi:hypothetical protein